jgi:putative aldouronate transport system permease protein
MSHDITKIIENVVKEIAQNKYLYLLLLPALIYVVMIDYSAMYGIQLAFKEFNPKLGIFGSEWVGLKHFKSMFSDPYFIYVVLNTVKISIGRIVFTFPFPIIIALCFNELKNRHFKKTIQTVYTFPHFLSWVIVSGVIINFLSHTGPVNDVLEALGMERHVFMGDKKAIIPILYITTIWKEAGWKSIIFLAAITSIDRGMYEAADLDGATRLKKMWHITLPSIRSTILIMLIMEVGHVLSGGFDQIFNMSNMVVQKTIDIIDTYVYRITFQQAPDFAYSTAVGLFKNVVGFSMVMIVNKISRKLEGSGILE